MRTNIEQAEFTVEETGPKQATIFLRFGDEQIEIAGDPYDIRQKLERLISELDRKFQNRGSNFR